MTLLLIYYLISLRSEDAKTNWKSYEKQNVRLMKIENDYYKLMFMMEITMELEKKSLMIYFRNKLQNYYSKSCVL
jgi:hypothetical protein